MWLHKLSSRQPALSPCMAALGLSWSRLTKEVTDANWPNFADRPSLPCPRGNLELTEGRPTQNGHPPRGEGLYVIQRRSADIGANWQHPLTS